MIEKTVEFLDAMSTGGPVGKDWYIVEVEGYGYFAWRESDKDSVYKIDNIQLWLEEKSLSRPVDVVSCPARYALSKRAKIKPLDSQTVELWINVIVPNSLKDKIRVEAYTDQNNALLDAESELKSALEVHTQRVEIEVP